MITHEEARKRLMNMDIKNVSYDDIWFFTQYISQQEKKDIIAQKEHELLEWYRESWKTMRDGRLESKINKLEKELEALK